jgi:hypothetical protein
MYTTVIRRIQLHKSSLKNSERLEVFFLILVTGENNVTPIQYFAGIYFYHVIHEGHTSSMACSGQSEPHISE